MCEKCGETCEQRKIEKVNWTYVIRRRCLSLYNACKKFMNSNKNHLTIMDFFYQQEKNK